MRLCQQGQWGPDSGHSRRLFMQWLRRNKLFGMRPLIMKDSLRIGTRRSQLALWQANWVKSELLTRFPSLSIQLVTIKTKGDKILDVPLAKVGGKGLFVKEIEEALLQNRVDIAVHSMKDMPADLPPGLCIGPIPKRENPADVLIAKNNLPFAQLSAGVRIGTSSLRRAAQLLSARPEIEIVPLRGNLDTRLKKLMDPAEELDAIILAAAGVLRLGLESRITEYLDSRIMLSAAGQGALCIEIRQDDRRVAEKVDWMNHPPTRQVVLGERAFLHRLEGSCQVPIAAHGDIMGNEIQLDGLVADVDGRKIIRDRLTGPAEAAEAIGRDLADRLLTMGADKILEQLAANE